MEYITPLISAQLIISEGILCQSPGGDTGDNNGGNLFDNDWGEY